MQLDENGHPRRCRVDLLTPIETQARELVIAIEGLGAHPLLTDASVLVQQAREKLADYTENPNTIGPATQADYDYIADKVG